ncbi:MAG: hypothetical protein H6974_09970 [Gammaproteobacteria bacterium]|nr:hypothetical protein [Gammaproteobacteria bacterium]
MEDSVASDQDSTLRLQVATDAGFERLLIGQDWFYRPGCARSLPQNQLAVQFNAAVAAADRIPGASPLPLIDDETYAHVLERGIAYLHQGKQNTSLRVTERCGRRGLNSVS